MQLQPFYTSNSQILITSDSNNVMTNVEMQSTCVIKITEVNCSITLPDYKEIDRKVKSIIYNNEQNNYTITFVEGGLLAVFDDKLFLNIMETQSLACEFRLKNYIAPTYSEKIVDEMESETNRNVEMYGELGAYCIANNVIVPGVDSAVVTSVYGSWQDISMKRVNNEKTEIAIMYFADRYVVFENAIVVLVKEYDN